MIKPFFRALSSLDANESQICSYWLILEKELGKKNRIRMVHMRRTNG